MAWQKLGVARSEKVIVDEVDVKHFVTRYLQAELGSTQVVCEEINNHKAVVRVPSAILAQEVYLLEYDLAQLLKEQANFKLKKLKVKTILRD